MMDKEEKPDFFKEAIQKHLEGLAESDPHFAERYKIETKNIDKCISYIYNTVRKSGRMGFTDDEVYGMAVHYYDEDDVDAGKDMKMDVVVNYDLSEYEKEQARKAAIKKAQDEAYAEIKKKYEKPKKPYNPLVKKDEAEKEPEKAQGSLF